MKKPLAKSTLGAATIAVAILHPTVISQASAADLNLGDRVPATHEVIEALRPAGQPRLPTISGTRFKYRGATQKARGIELSQAPTPLTTKPTNIKTSNNRSTGNGIAIPVLFSFDSFSLTPRAVRQLIPIAEAMNSDELSGLIFRIEGHTDATGPAPYNFQLSTQRANSVRNHLVDNHKIPSEKLFVVGLGESVLANRAFPEDPGNRRVRIVVHAQ